MRDNDAEALSALMDGEATELELRALVRDTARDPELAAKWSRYHLASAVLHKQVSPVRSRSLLTVDLADRVARAIDEEPEVPVVTDTLPVSGGLGQRWRNIINVAVAASVAVAVVAGWEFVRPGATGGAGLTQATASAQTAFQSGAAMPVSFGQNLPGAMQPGVRLQQPLNEAPADERFNRYLISHSGNAALATHGGSVSYVRVVTLKPAGAGVHH